MAVDAASEQPAPAELWRHSDPDSTPMARFMRHVNSKYGLSLSDYPTLYRWSVDNVAEFWEECWHFCGIRASQSYDEVGDLEERDTPLHEKCN